MNEPKSMEQASTLSDGLNSTNDSLQSYRAELINESLQEGRLLNCDEFIEKSSLILGHLRSQQKISLTSIEEIYNRQLRRNKTSDKLLSAIERLDAVRINSHLDFSNYQMNIMYMSYSYILTC